MLLLMWTLLLLRMLLLVWTLLLLLRMQLVVAVVYKLALAAFRLLRTKLGRPLTTLPPLCRMSHR